MPYALFCQDSKISRSFPTEAEVWKHAADNGLVVDIASDDENESPRQILDKEYIIRKCAADPVERHDPAATGIELPQPS